MCRKSRLYELYDKDEWNYENVFSVGNEFVSKK